MDIARRGLKVEGHGRVVCHCRGQWQRRSPVRVCSGYAVGLTSVLDQRQFFSRLQARLGACVGPPVRE